MSGGRIAHIDALRAVAVILVIWTHYAEGYVALAGSQHALDAIQNSVNFGRIGVVIFFAISGFVIPTSLRGERMDGVKQFVKKRFFRLYPAFWLSIPLYIGCRFLLDLPSGVSDIIGNATMMPSAFGLPPLPILGIYWTLETELYFYAFCLLLFWFGGLHRMAVLVAVTIGLSLAFVVVSALRLIPDDAAGLYKGLLFHLAIMFWGACFRKAWDDPSANRLLGAGLATAMLCVVAVAMLVRGYQGEAKLFSNAMAYLIGLTAFGLFTTVLRIDFHPMIWLGKISYSIYLLHSAPLLMISWYCAHTGLTGLPLGLYMLATLLIAIILSWMSYILIERPGMRLANTSLIRNALQASPASA